MDLYNLHSGGAFCQNLEPSIGTVTKLQVLECVDPAEWLNCVKWTRYVTTFGSKQCLQVWVQERKGKLKSYYAIGESGTCWISDENETVQVSKETVDVLCRKSSEYCNEPRTLRVAKMVESQF